MTGSPLADAVGIYPTWSLEARGIDRRHRMRLIEEGRLVPVTRGWFATRDADQTALMAMRSGARLTCISAARIHGLWSPLVPGMHVYARRGRVPPRFIAHGPYCDAWPETEPVASLGLCLQHAARCLTPEQSAILFESSMTHKLLTPGEVGDLARPLPLRIRSRLGVLSGLSQSGSETRVARWLRGRGIAFTQQARIPGVGKVDFLVGRSWVIETDSKAHHTAVPNYETDRRRDLAARLLGYSVTRLSFTQVWDDWAATQRDLGALIATRHHLRVPRAA
ncbi:hypothetical protein [Ruania alba]|uniref:DUF559 domain-containing protein n=1 Tax=Ruania alba TaxID=648782 RepID=A0A1H5MQN1_9MICO|nr:hypothetical protein [Ruania alba]SEE91450.1 hypothetical protein SAMN04488554_3553 [Ruania alba]